MVDDGILRSQRVTIVQRLAQQVTAYREEHQMTKTQFAKECGVSMGFLRRLERGEANPTLDMIERMANYMAVTPTQLLFPY